MRNGRVKRRANDVKRVHQIVRPEKDPRESRQAKRDEDSHDIVKRRPLCETNRFRERGPHIVAEGSHGRIRRPHGSEPGQ